MFANQIKALEDARRSLKSQLDAEHRSANPNADELFVVRATSLRVDRSEDANFNTNETVFRALWDLDSKVIDPAGIVSVTNA